MFFHTGYNEYILFQDFYTKSVGGKYKNLFTFSGFVILTFGKFSLKRHKAMRSKSDENSGLSHQLEK